MTEYASASSTNDRLWNVLCHLSPFLGVALILSIVAAIKASREEVYRYPLTLRLVG